MVNAGSKPPKIAHLPISLQEDNSEKGALEILEVVRPNWNKRENISFKLLTDGLSNKLLKCDYQDYQDSVLIRIYGRNTDLFIDRKAETENILILNEYGLAPRLYATFENGLAYEYVPGSILTVKTVTYECVYKLVAERLANFHRVVTGNGPRKATLWTKMEKYFNLIPERFSDGYKQERFKSLNLSKQDISNEIVFLKKTLLKLDSPVVFAHNDLLLANVIHSEGEGSVKFIDYEYAGLNYQAFDIANHFNEFAGVDNVDYSYYPNKEFQLKWLGIYLSAYHGHENISKNEINKLYTEVDQFVLASHVFWGIWAFIQAEHSTIGFDFISYAGIRFNEYFSRKDALLALPV